MSGRHEREAIFNLVTSEEYRDQNNQKVLGEQQAAIANPPALTAPTTGSGADGTTPSGSEYTDMHSDINTLRSTIITLLAALRTHGIIDT